MMMAYEIYAITRCDGPVLIGSYESRSAQRAAYREALRELADGGYSEDVINFALGATMQSGGATDVQAVADESDVRPTRGRSMR